MRYIREIWLNNTEDSEGFKSVFVFLGVTFCFILVNNIKLAYRKELYPTHYKFYLSCTWKYNFAFLSQTVRIDCHSEYL
jgi:hypothetical protein